MTNVLNNLIHVRITEDIKENIDLLCRETGASRSEVIRDALDLYFKEDDAEKEVKTCKTV